MLIVALSTAACAVAQSYWQLLTFRALGDRLDDVLRLGAGSDDPDEPARRPRPGRRAVLRAFLVGSVAGPVVGALTAGLGLSAPFVIYGGLLLIAAAVVLVSLRNSPLAAPADSDELAVTVRVALRHRAYRSALLFNFATGWSLFGLRFALVPLFVAEVLGHPAGVAGLALTAFAAGNVAVVMYSGRISDRIGRKPLLVVGLALSGVSTAMLGLTHTLPVFLTLAVVAGRRRVLQLPQQAAVADIIGKARGGTAIATFQMMSDFGSIVGSLGVGCSPSSCPSVGVCDQRAMLLVAAVGWTFAPETRDRSPVPHTPARALGPEAAGESCPELVLRRTRRWWFQLRLGLWRSW